MSGREEKEGMNEKGKTKRGTQAKSVLTGTHKVLCVTFDRIVALHLFIFLHAFVA